MTDMCKYVKNGVFLTICQKGVKGRRRKIYTVFGGMKMRNLLFLDGKQF